MSSDVEESYPSSPRATNTTLTEAAGDVVDPHLRVVKSARMKANPKPSKTPHIEELVEMVWKLIHKDTPQSCGSQGSSDLRISDSLSEKIMSL